MTDKVEAAREAIDSAHSRLAALDWELREAHRAMSAIVEDTDTFCALTIQEKTDCAWAHAYAIETLQAMHAKEASK